MDEKLESYSVAVEDSYSDWEQEWHQHPVIAHPRHKAILQNKAVTSNFAAL